MPEGPEMSPPHAIFVVEVVKFISAVVVVMFAVVVVVYVTGLVIV